MEITVTVVQSDFLACSRVDILSIFWIIIQQKSPVADWANPELAETFETLYFETQEDYFTRFLSFDFKPDLYFPSS